MSASIDIFPWNDHFDTGLPTVDAQHRQLVRLLNRLASQLAFTPDGPQLKLILDELTDYTIHHFADEELIWGQYLPADPLASEHQAGHALFVARIQAMRTQLDQRPLAEVAEGLLEFLARWLASHILESDRRMAYTVHALQSGQDLETAKEQAGTAMAGATRTLIDIILSIYGSLSTNTLRLMREIHDHQQAATALQASEHRLRQIMERAPLAYQELDMAGRIRLVNRAWLVQSGHARHEVVGEDFLDLMSPGSRQRFAEELARLPHTGRIDHLPCEIRRPQGQVLLWELNARVAWGPQRQPLGVHCLLTDTTERQHLLAQLNRKNQYQQLLLHLSSTFINAPLAEMDVAIQTALGQMAHFIQTERAGLFRYHFDQGHATNTHEWCAPEVPPRRAQRQKLPLDTLAERVRTHRQGQPYLIEAVDGLPAGALRDDLADQGILSLLTLPLMNGPDCLGYVGFEAIHAPRRFSEDDLQLLRLFANLLTHLHARQHMEAALDHERSLLRTLVQTIPDLVWLKNPDGVYLACNHRFEQLYGAPQSEIVGRTDLDFVAPALADFFRTHDQRAIAQGGTIVTEELLTFACDGHQELTETTKTPMFDACGQLVGVLGIGRDITEREHIRQELRRRDSYQRAVLDNFPFLIWLKDEASRFLAVNTPFAHASGVARPQDLIGKTDQDIWPADLARRYREDDLEVLRSGQPKNVEEPMEGPGQQGWIETFKAPVRIDDQVLGTVGFARDITERKAGEERLALAASVFTHAHEGIMITSPDGTVLDVNDAFTRITGYSREEMIGHNANLLNSGRQDKAFYTALWKTLTSTGNWVGELWNRRKNGEVYVEQLTISAVRNARGETIRYAGMFADISQQKAHAQRLEQIAHYDALTNLPNRTLLADRLRQAMAQAVRRGEKLALAFIDLDGFKSVNDTHGHVMGDKLLIALATRMGSSLREGDTLARLGGDEFVAVLINLNGPGAAHPVLERMRLAAAQPFQVDGHELQVSASMGVVFYPQQSEMDADQLLRQADQAMYQAKLAGKNRYHLFDTAHDRHLRGLHEDLQAVREALQRNEFELFYQPKVNMRTGELVGTEALLRWHHRSRGLLSPGAFLPSLHGNALAVELGEWVLETALRQIEDWKHGNLQIPVSVNIDGLHLQQADFVPRLQALLARHPLVKPGDLELEVLESSALDDIVTVSNVIRACRSLGVDFALDDFGTGYSSLTYLRRLPASVLKIDISFVRDLLDDPNDMAILEGVLGLARAFRTQVIAEGVETIAHGDMLLRLGCDWGQGYAIARAMPAQALVAWLADWQVPAAWLHQSMAASQDLPLLSATVEHRAWVRQLATLLQGQAGERPTLGAEACQFGRWLASEATRQRHQHNPRLAAIATLHEHIHRLAEQALSQHESPAPEGALETLKIITQQRDQLIGQMMTLLDEAQPAS